MRHGAARGSIPGGGGPGGANNWPRVRRLDGRAESFHGFFFEGFLMAKNIYVGNLVWDCTADDLLALFQEHGKVTRAQVITDRETGRSRGFGFVEMDDDAEAQKAIDALNNSDYNGRPLTVNEAKPREDRGGGGRGGYGGGGGSSRGGYGGGRGGYGGGTDRGRRY